MHSAELSQVKRLLGQLPAAIALFDANSRVIAASHRWCDEYRLTIEQARGLSYPESFPSQAQQWNRYFPRAYAGEHMHFEEDKLLLANGVQEIIRWELMPWRDESGDICAVVQLVEVVTAQYRARESLLEIQTSLEQKVEERTEELASTLTMLEYASKANEDFFTNMTHELRTPLHAIINFSGFGIKRIEKAPKEKLLEYFADIHRSGKRLLGLVDDILDLSKQRAGQWTLEIADHSVNQLVAGVLKEVSSLTEAKQIHVQWKPGEADFTLAFDMARMHQVLLNLMANAIKFSPRGGCIEVNARLMEGEHLQISVIDEGPGIPEDELQAVFNAFEQSKKVQSGEFGAGTGLGLSICRQIVKAHDGSIWAEQNPKGGAIVRFMLPIKDNSGE